MMFFEVHQKLLEDLRDCYIKYHINTYNGDNGAKIATQNLESSIDDLLEAVGMMREVQKAVQQDFQERLAIAKKAAK